MRFRTKSSPQTIQKKVVDTVAKKIKQAGKTVRICFVGSAYSSSLLAEKAPVNVVGPDVFQVILAKELIKHGFKVAIITYDEGRGGAPVERINGIDVVKIRRDNYRISKIDAILNILRTWDAMKKAKANIYLQRGGITGFFSPFCKLMNKKYVRLIASDALVNRELIDRNIKEFNLSKHSIGTFGYWLDLKLADAVIVQNEYQREMLNKNFGEECVLIKKPVPLTEWGMPEKANPPIVLWVGSMADVKQPESFVKLAEAIPEGRFQMIGGCSPDNQELYNGIKEKSKRIPNFEFLGVIPFHKVNEYFSRASILVNTSLFEAYPPYAFIQAWMNYTPVVSLRDNSDEIIRRYKLGFHSKTFNQLVEDAKTLLRREQLREKMGRNGRQYVEKEHDIKNIIGKYIELFDRMVNFR